MPAVVTVYNYDFYSLVYILIVVIIVVGLGNCFVFLDLLKPPSAV